MLIFNQFIKISEGPKIFFEAFVVELLHFCEPSHHFCFCPFVDGLFFHSSHLQPTEQLGCFTLSFDISPVVVRINMADSRRIEGRVQKQVFRKVERKRDLLFFSHTLQISQKHIDVEKKKKEKKCIFHNYVSFKLLSLKPLFVLVID